MGRRHQSVHTGYGGTMRHETIGDRLKAGAGRGIPRVDDRRTGVSASDERQDRQRPSYLSDQSCHVSVADLSSATGLSPTREQRPDTSD